jgi:long-chain acyl-CoA synthetase
MGWIASGERLISSRELTGRAEKAASVLENFGVKAGDGVALFLRNELAFFEASIATGMLGAYAVPVNWHYTVDEAQYLLVDSGARVLLIHADLLPAIAEAVPASVPTILVEPSPELISAYHIDPEAARAPKRQGAWRALVDAAPPRATPPATPPSTIIYTSGTTGRPKGVRRPPFTPEQQLATIRMLGWSYGYTEVLEGRRAPETITTAVIGPLYHAAPNAHAGVSIQLGMNVRILPRFDPEELLATIERDRITHLNMVPIMFVRLLKLPDEVRRRYDLSSLEYVTHAAAPCPPPVKRAMIEWWGPIIWEYYGSTEMGNVTNLSSAEWLAHPGSVGRVMPDVDLRVVDDAGRDVAAGTVGEVIARGRMASDFTYQNAPEKRREMEREGLIAPGDLGYFDADGFLYLCDRKNNMIISGGANIYPAEVEAELQKLPGVADCAVFGIPDEEFGESVCAYIQPEVGAGLTADNVRADLRRVLTGYKVPRTIEFVEALPREDSGKIFKRKLREPYWVGKGTRI